MMIHNARPTQTAEPSGRPSSTAATGVPADSFATLLGGLKATPDSAPAGDDGQAPEAGAEQASSQAVARGDAPRQPVMPKGDARAAIEPMPAATIPLPPEPAAVDRAAAPQVSGGESAEREPAAEAPSGDTPAAAYPTMAYAGALAMLPPALPVQVAPATAAAAGRSAGGTVRAAANEREGPTQASADADPGEAPSLPGMPTGAGSASGFEVAGVEAEPMAALETTALQAALPATGPVARAATGAMSAATAASSTDASPATSAPAAPAVDSAAPLFPATTAAAQPAAEAADLLSDRAPDGGQVESAIGAAIAAPALKAELLPEAAPAPPPPSSAASAAYPLDMHVGRIIKLSEDRISIVLDPPELGAMHVTLHGRKGKDLSASIVVDRPETLDLLRRESGAMERMLGEAGIQLDPSGLQVALRQDNPEGRQAGARTFERPETQAGLETHDQSAAQPQQGRPSSTRLLDLLA